MAKPLTIIFTPEQRRKLEYARDHHQKPYVRERASAIPEILHEAQNSPKSAESLFHFGKRFGAQFSLIRPQIVLSTGKAGSKSLTTGCGSGNEFLRRKWAVQNLCILKIADGMSGRQVALNGLLKRRKPDTVYD